MEKQQGTPTPSDQKGLKRKENPVKKGSDRDAKKPRTMPLFKNILDSPFHSSWPSIEPAHKSQVIALLSSHFKEFASTRRTRNKADNKKKKKKNDPQGDDMDKKEDKDNKEDKMVVEEAKPERAELPSALFGMNRVTRGLEHDDVALVIVARSTEPPSVIQHLPELCARKKVPLLPLELDSQALGQLLGLRTLLALAFKKGDPLTSSLVQKIAPLCPSYNLPWVAVSTSGQLVDLLPLHFKRTEFTKKL